ncbi:MAG TPA: group 1 truncated hemoglobin [Candidatus Solibacter sp.]|nr:group 1 truncated hemoglobin [Candidatus Solibacter sp.]
MINELFDLIGGKQILSAATEDFYRRVLADETLRPFFATTDMGQLLARQRMFLSMLLGGKGSYTGRDISSVHGEARRQGLNDGHFDRFLKHFRDALDAAGVEQDKIDEIAQLLESRRGAVLNPGTLQKAF